MKNQYSHLTAKERDKLSFPMHWLLKNEYLTGKVLDFGCGLGSDVGFLKSKGVDVVGYDPHYFPAKPTKTFDVITCIYVLNVLEAEEQSQVIMEVSQLLKHGGKAYFAVRRDLKKTGYRTHYVHKKPTFQTNVLLPFKSIFKNDFTEIYEFQHWEISSTTQSTCPFCNLQKQVILESASAFSIFDKYPVSNGHALIIPKKHIGDYFELTNKEKTALNLVLEETKKVIAQKFRPDGFNIGINIGKHAGQTVPHVHIHLIPRYKNDVENPIGGVRNTIPGKGDYLIEGEGVPVSVSLSKQL